MILISMRFGQGIGNQLWLLATGLYLSKKYNRKLVVKNMKWFLGKNIVSKDLFSYITAWTSDYYKFKWVTFNDTFFQEENSNRLCYLPLLENTFKLLNNFEYVFLDGNFQSINMIPNNDLLSKFFINKEFEYDRKFNKNECIINIRGGDYLGLTKSPAVPYKYWHKIVEHFKEKNDINKFYIVTDDYKYANILFPNFEILKGSMEEDYFSILNAKNLILSNSSFSFFPSYLNKIAKRIVSPKYCAPILLKNKKLLWGSPTNIYPFMEYYDWNNNKIEKYDKNYVSSITKDTLDTLIPSKRINYFQSKNKLFELLRPIDKINFHKKHPGLKYIDSYKVRWRNLILLGWKIRRIIFLIYYYCSKIT